MFSKCYIMKLTLILSVLALHQAPAGPLFGNGYGARSASFRMGFGTGTSMDGGNRFAPYSYHMPIYAPRAQASESGLTDAEFGAFEIEEIGDHVRVSVPLNLVFDFDRHDLRPDAEQILQAVTRIAHCRNATGIELRGHTDAIGTDEYNQRLSNLRTYAAKRWLITEGGFPVETVDTHGHGESQPVAPNSYPNGADNPYGRAMNRRVEFVI
jgi:outer membrane protein OmpA-like peptidoglycan-associated protein